MSSKKKTPTKMLKNLLTTGSIENDGKEDVNERAPTENTVVVQEETERNEVLIEDIVRSEPVQEKVKEPIETESKPMVADHEPVVTAEEKKEPTIIQSEEPLPTQDVKVNAPTIEEEIEALRRDIAQFRTENSECITSKEQHKNYMDAVAKRDTEIANRKFMNMLEQMCIMREDFFKLCSDMEKKLDKFSPKDILDSFTAYSTDMENILIDAGVHIGKFDCERLNTIHQRIIDVVPTDDETLNGTIAERLSYEYEFNGRILFKEKVKIYKFTTNNQSERSNNKEE
ncbi:MAG: hypothetical protein KRP56_03110 [Candidatus Methanogranum gryphiswaldense]|nr:MAG: hypothetical protein KRP56_03110 [Candidatus Methanogranum sp. U3.2.1]